MKTDLLVNFSVDKENNKIKVEREFAAPVANVWAAWTQSNILDQWWAPKPWKARTKSQDFKEGGSWLYAMVGPEGEEHWARLDYKSISPLKSFSGIDAFCDEEGNLNPDFGRSTWTNQFTGTSDSTTVSINIQYDNLADLEQIIQMGFKEGFLAGMENLDEYFRQ
ncbi:MAG: SRPBCC domain-containing protein [Dyadobacter sp.]|uniref:SRPBCC family protein n=1 Tax=Dyadobacter sp. TaxID=1914288 RepID=UPI0032673713